MKHFILILLITLSSCATKKHIEYIEKTDTLIVNNYTHKIDSFIQKDSVIMFQKGDTVIIKEKSVINNIRYQDKQNDSIKTKVEYRDREIYIEKKTMRHMVFPYLCGILFIILLYLGILRLRKRM